MTCALWLPAAGLAIGFLLGLFTGAFVTACCVAARRGDSR